MQSETTTEETIGFVVMFFVIGGISIGETRPRLRYANAPNKVFTFEDNFVHTQYS